MHDDLPTCAEFDALVKNTIDAFQSDIDAYEERVALQTADDGKTTTQRALDALQRPEHFNGEHDVACAWLKMHEPNGHIFTNRRRS